MIEVLRTAHIVVATVLIGLILLQQRGGGLSSTFGGMGVEFYGTRRGIEKFVFMLTIIFATLFIGISAVNLLVR